MSFLKCSRKLMLAPCAALPSGPGVDPHDTPASESRGSAASALGACLCAAHRVDEAYCCLEAGAGLGAAACLVAVCLAAAACLAAAVFLAAAALLASGF